MTISETKDLFTIYVPKNEPGYELNAKIWTKTSESLLWRDGVMYCANRNAEFQTLDGAVEFRHDTNGADNSDSHQNTGTLIAVVRDGKLLRAHIYEPSREVLEQIINHEGLIEAKSAIKLLTNSSLARNIVASTKKTERTFIIPEQNLVLAVELTDGKTSYASNEAVQCLMPENAGKNASYIRNRGYSEGRVYFERPSLEKGQMKIRPVSLGGGTGSFIINCSLIYDVYVGNDFNCGGRARGQSTSAKKSPVEKKG